MFRPQAPLRLAGEELLLGIIAPTSACRRCWQSGILGREIMNLELENFAASRWRRPRGPIMPITEMGQA